MMLCLMIARRSFVMDEEELSGSAQSLLPGLCCWVLDGH